MSKKVKDSEIKIIIKHNDNHTISESDMSIQANVPDAVFAAISLLEWAVHKNREQIDSPVGLSAHIAEGFNALAKLVCGDDDEKDQD